PDDLLPGGRPAVARRIRARPDVVELRQTADVRDGEVVGERRGSGEKQEENEAAHAESTLGKAGSSTSVTPSVSEGAWLCGRRDDVAARADGDARAGAPRRPLSRRPRAPRRAARGDHRRPRASR